MSIDPAKSYHHGNLRRQAIDTTIELLKTDEISQISLRKLAETLKVSHNALYKHFQNKDALLAEVVQEGFTMFRDELQAEVNKYPNEPIKQLQNMGVAYVKFALNYPSYYRVMFGAYRTKKPTKSPLLSSIPIEMSTLSVEQIIRDVEPQTIGFINVKEEAFMVLVNTVIRCQEAGLIKPDDPKTQALACWSIVHGLAMLFINGQVLITEEKLITFVSALIVQFLIEGLSKVQ